MYFTFIPLLKFFDEQHVKATGTLMRYRTPKINRFKTHVQLVSSDNKVIIIKWYDNKLIYLEFTE